MSATAIHLEDTWAAAAVLIGFQLAAFTWRLEREMKLSLERKAKGRKRPIMNWFPPADYLNLLSLLVNILGTFLLPIKGILCNHAAQVALGISLILFAGYPFAVVGHYGLLFNMGRFKLPGRFATLQEWIVIVVTIIFATVYAVC